MERIFTLQSLADRSLIGERALTVLASEIAAGRLASLDDYNVREVRAADGTLGREQRRHYAEMRMTAAALLAWAAGWPDVAAMIFHPELIGTWSPVGATITLEA